MLFLYKFENDQIKDLFKLIFNNANAATFGSYDNSYIWGLLPEVLDTLITARLLKANNEVLFERRTKLKKSGKVRVYYAPHDEIKRCLRELNVFFQRIYDSKNADFQVAYKKGKSVYNNAEIHKENKYVYNIDLKDFYPSCKKDLVRNYVEFLFNAIPGKVAVLEEFLDIITIDDGLFIGSPISGCLANAILSQAVKYIKNMCLKNDMEFSVYADDMTFSSNKRIKKENIEHMFSEAFVTYHLDQYFSLNEDKSVGFTGKNRKVTGVSINENNDLTTKRRYYREVRSMINHLANDQVPTVNVNKLRGKIAYGVMIDDSGKFYRYLKKYMDTVKQYKLCSDEKLNELKTRFEK